MTMAKLRFNLSGRVIKIAFLILIAFGLFSILKDVDFGKLVPVLKQISYPLLLLIFVLSGLNILLVALRWRVLLTILQRDFSFRNILNATIGAMLINTSGPGKLGVPAKAFLIKKMEGVDYSQSTPTLLMELFFEVFSLGVLLLLSAFVVGLHQMIFSALGETVTVKNLLVLAAGLVLFAVLALIFRRKLIENKFLSDFFKAVVSTVMQTRVFLAAFAISIINLLVNFLGDFLLFKALGQQIPYSFIAFSSSFATVTGLISPLPSGLGVWELSRAYLFETYYAIGEIAVLMTLIRRLLSYLMLGLLYLITVKSKMKAPADGISEIAPGALFKKSVTDMESQGFD
jgi:uncharacterized protein (TIRG00374 family)